MTGLAHGCYRSAFQTAKGCGTKAPCAMMDPAPLRPRGGCCLSGSEEIRSGLRWVQDTAAVRTDLSTDPGPRLTAWRPANALCLRLLLLGIDTKAIESSGRGPEPIEREKIVNTGRRFPDCA